jgi:hypothetical protein
VAEEEVVGQVAAVAAALGGLVAVVAVAVGPVEVGKYRLTSKMFIS